VTSVTDAAGPDHQVLFGLDAGDDVRMVLRAAAERGHQRAVTTTGARVSSGAAVVLDAQHPAALERMTRRRTTGRGRPASNGRRGRPPGPPVETSGA